MPSCRRNRAAAAQFPGRRERRPLQPHLPNRDLPRRLVHPFNVDAKGIFQIQQLRAVLAPLAGDNGPHVEVVVESGGGQVALGVDAV